MPMRLQIKPKRSLRENARLIIPSMLDDFFSMKARVIAHPRLKPELHRMRIAGKTLRYGMEVFEPGFQSGFASSLENLKLYLETMGRIHDCDVNIPRLQSYLKVIRLFNGCCDNMKDKIPTSAIMRIIREQSDLRRQLFAEMISILERWERERFKETILKSMESNNFVKD